MFRSLRVQMFVWGLSALVAMLGLLLWNAQHLMADTLKERFDAEAQQLRPLLQAAVGPLLISRDYATLNGVVRDSVGQMGLAYLEVLDSRGAATARSGRLPDDSTHVLAVSMPLTLEGQRLGELRFGLHTGALERSQQRMLHNSLAIGGLVLLIGATILALGSTWLSGGLRRLAEASRRLAEAPSAAPPTVVLPASPVHELQVVGEAFERMAQVVQTQLTTLRESEALLCSVIDTLAEGAVMLSLPQREVTRANDAALLMCGGTRAEVHRALAELPMRLDLRDHLIEHQRPDGSPVWLSINASTLRRENETEPHALVVTLSDVTRHVLAERELRTLNEGLERRVDERTAQLQLAKDVAEKANQAKSEFLSRMSHELRTPLNAILGFAQLLGLAKLDAESLAQVRHVEAAGWHLLALIDEVLDLSRIEAGAMTTSIEPVALQALVAESVEMARGAAEQRGVRLINQVANAAPITVMADRMRLKQVLGNLLSNGAKYNRPEGSATITATRLDATQRVRIDVADTGRGFTPEQLDALFRPFTRFEQPGETIQGTGIGLVITRRLVELMGGTLQIESVAGRGSVFSFELPLAQEAALPAAEVSTPMLPSGGPGAGRQALLYVEDNPSNVELMRQLVALRPDWALSVATDGLAGLAMARGQPPALAIIDIDLPGIDGLDLCRRLRNDPRTRDIPLIGLSANAMADDVTRARDAGFDLYLTKPMDLPRMLAEIERLLPGRGA